MQKITLILKDIDLYLGNTRILIDKCINTPQKKDLLADSVALDIKVSSIIYKINNIDVEGILFVTGVDKYIQPLHNINLDIADLLHCLHLSNDKIFCKEKLLSRTYAKIMKANYAIINNLLQMKTDIFKINSHLLN